MAREQIGHKHPEGSAAPGLGVVVTASGGTTRTLKAEDADSLNLLDSASGVAYTLPAPVAGMRFRFYASVSVTSSDTYAINTDAATTFIGGAVVMGIHATDTNETQVGDETSDVTITMNGSTTGGLIGTYIEVFAISTTVWVATGHVVGSGSLATPFA